MNTTRLLLLSGVLALAGAAGFAQSTSVPTPPAATVATGVDFSRGDYGFATDTEVLSFPLDLGYENGAWLWRASFSWLRIKGPAAIIGAGAAPRPTAGSESGAGDIYLGGTYRMGAVLGDVNLDATVRVKVPTASESRGLGTGEADVYGQLDAYHTIGNLTPFASLGYRVLGDNTTYQLEDGVYASGGLHIRTSTATVVTASVNWGQPIVAAGDNTTDAMLAFTHDIDSSWRVMAYALKGFTDASPDVGGGARIT